MLCIQHYAKYTSEARQKDKGIKDVLAINSSYLIKFESNEFICTAA